jgi:hypothetical protein
MPLYILEMDMRLTLENQAHEILTEPLAHQFDLHRH